MKRYVKFIFIFLIFFISCAKVTSPPYISPPIILGHMVYSSNCIGLFWWDTSDNEDGFKIDRKIEDTEWEIARGITSENVINWDDILNCEFRHYYRVYAFKGKYRSEYSNIYEIGGG
ncbi:MAG: hypothetical protein KAU01_05880 [Candidatus Cloacimonetes bacterium]|nr:hypothetical protein [Candidatus Cloacimonadota bacterium]